MQIRTKEQDGPDDLDLPTQLRRLQQNLAKLRTGRRNPAPGCRVTLPMPLQIRRVCDPTRAVFDVTLKSAGYLSGVPGESVTRVPKEAVRYANRTGFDAGPGLPSRLYGTTRYQPGRAAA